MAVQGELGANGGQRANYKLQFPFRCRRHSSMVRQCRTEGSTVNPSVNSAMQSNAGEIHMPPSDRMIGRRHVSATTD